MTTPTTPAAAVSLPLVMSEAHDIGAIIEALEQYTRGDDHQRAIDAAVEVLRAAKALQTSRQPQAQQGGGDLSIYKARWCFALAESDDWTYAVCKWDGADWLPIKTEDDLRIFDAALATKEPK